MYRLPVSLVRLLCAAAASCVVPVAAVAAPLEPGTLESPARLAPGQFHWQPSLSPDGPLEIVVGLNEQIAYVFRSGVLIGSSTISSGRPGHESPIGRFQVLEKKRVHRSNRYDDAPMPFMQRLNWHGVALHAGEVSGSPASHGCIRLPSKFAKVLFDATEVGSSVFVTEDALDSPEAALQLARANAAMPMADSRLPRTGATIASK
jgi:hypothetical protein